MPADAVAPKAVRATIGSHLAMWPGAPSPREVETLLGFYDAADKGGSRTAWDRAGSGLATRTLSSGSNGSRKRKTGTTYRVSDVTMASRSRSPSGGPMPAGHHMMADAISGELSATAARRRRARMLAIRADAMGPRFAGQWLRRRTSTKAIGSELLSEFRSALCTEKRETEMFFMAPCARTAAWGSLRAGYSI